MLSAGARILLADRKLCGPVGVGSVGVPIRGLPPTLLHILSLRDK
jgi:hypothetical protein